MSTYSFAEQDPPQHEDNKRRLSTIRPTPGSEYSLRHDLMRDRYQPGTRKAGRNLVDACTWWF